MPKTVPPETDLAVIPCPFLEDAFLISVTVIAALRKLRKRAEDEMGPDPRCLPIDNLLAEWKATKKRIRAEMWSLVDFLSEPPLSIRAAHIAAADSHGWAETLCHGKAFEKLVREP